VKKWWLLFLSLLLLDALTKALAMQYLPQSNSQPFPFGGIPIFTFSGVTFSLNFVTNTGAAWGLLAGHAGELFLFRILIIAILLYSMPKRIPAWLIVTGAIGNAMDYCFYGQVIDFFHFTFWGHSFPIFNVADSCISIGVFSLLFLSNKAKAAQSL